MIDAREAVAKETAERWLSKTFAPPMGLRVVGTEDAQAERANDIRAAIFDALPRGKDRLELLERCEDARKNLTRGSKTMTWPTPKEILEAFRASVPKAEAGKGGWPHANSEYVIESTARWVRKFNEWPSYLQHHVEVARELVERGEYTRDEIVAAGFPAHLCKRDDSPRADIKAMIREAAEGRRMDTGLV